jgi:hypothetical protein
MVDRVFDELGVDRDTVYRSDREATVGCIDARSLAQANTRL